MRYIIPTLLILFLSSCIRIGDGMFVVQGELVGLPSKEKCLLSLGLESGEEALPWKTVEISGVFDSDFTISPYSRRYQVRILCNGHLVVSRLVNYPKDMGVGGTVDLGKVSVQ